MAYELETRGNLAKREAAIDHARNVVRGRFEEFDGIGAALVTVAEGTPDVWIGWSGMQDDASTVAAALERGRTGLVATGRGGVAQTLGHARLSSAVSLLERLGEFLGQKGT